MEKYCVRTFVMSFFIFQYTFIFHVKFLNSVYLFLLKSLPMEKKLCYCPHAQVMSP